MGLLLVRRPPAACRAATAAASYEPGEVRRCGACDRGAVLGRRSHKLHLCPLCGSDSVSRWLVDDLGDGMRARVLLSCAECDTTRVLVATTWSVDAYSRRHERQRWEIHVALQRAERQGMVADVEVLVAALRRDLIGPDDFASYGRPSGTRPRSCMP